MKTIIVPVFLLCMACVASAQPARRMQAGVTVQYDHYNFTDSNYGISATDDRGNLAFGVFFDAIYLRAAVQYQRTLSGTLAVAGYGSADYPTGFSISFLNLQVLGKYPLPLGSMTIWPAVGMRYSHPLTMQIGGVDYMSDPNIDVADLYVSFGGGIDFSSGSVIVGLFALYDYSLTPSQTKSPLYPGEQVSGFDLELGVSLGFAL
ncbi:MAG TPA: hypothetical protein VMV03_00475 [Spirochaetia bacterium]|nr:hypothetical protein [Spirochaetia bacterium]